MPKDQEWILTEEEKKNCDDMHRLCFNGIPENENAATSVLRIDGKLYSLFIKIGRDEPADEFIKLLWHLYMCTVRCIEKQYGVVDESTGDFIPPDQRPQSK